MCINNVLLVEHEPMYVENVCSNVFYEIVLDAVRILREADSEDLHVCVCVCVRACMYVCLVAGCGAG
jgi:hypothetical protein